MREIVAEHGVSLLIDEARGKYPRINEIYASLEWRLSRAPEDGIRISFTDPPAYLFQSMDVLGEPSILVLYEFDETCVTFLDIRIKEPD